MNDVTHSVIKPDDAVELHIEFSGFAALIAFFSHGVGMLNVLKMSTVVGGLPGMPDEQEHPNVQLRLEFLNAELATAWQRDHAQRLATLNAGCTMQLVGRRRRP